MKLMCWHFYRGCEYLGNFPVERFERGQPLLARRSLTGKLKKVIELIRSVTNMITVLGNQITLPRVREVIEFGIQLGCAICEKNLFKLDNNEAARWKSVGKRGGGCFPSMKYLMPGVWLTYSTIFSSDMLVGKVSTIQSSWRCRVLGILDY